MEKKPKCKEHNKKLQSFCTSCNTLLCFKCLAQHGKKGCKYPVDLPTYAQEQILPKYMNQLNEFELKKEAIESSVKEFITASEKIKGRLVELRRRLEQLLVQVDESVEILVRGVDQSIPLHETIKRFLTSQCEDLTAAIENENMGYIIKKIEEGEAISIIGLGDSERKLTDDVNGSIEYFLKSEEFGRLSLCLKAMAETYQKFSIQCASRVVNNNVYGICSTQSNYTKLCVYNIQTRKIVPSIPVPQWCTITQIGSRTFLSGGCSPAITNSVCEYQEETSCLVPVEPMKYAKFCHRTEVISPNAFVTIGGDNGTVSIPYCEEYSVSDNKWLMLPPLMKARHCTGSAYLGKFLYAIGGKSTGSEIERLDVGEKKFWMPVNAVLNGVSFSGETLAFAISAEEIMIFRGGNTTEASIFSVKSGVIKKYDSSLKGDFYRFNPACQIGRNIYIIGNYGHIHIYKMSENKFEEVDYQAALLN